MRKGMDARPDNDNTSGDRSCKCSETTSYANKRALCTGIHNKTVGGCTKPMGTINERNTKYKWSKEVITAIQHYTLEVWKERNEVEHGITLEAALKR